MTVANAKPDQLIRGPLGTTTVNAASSAWWDVSTVEAKITEAIAYAVSIGAKAVYVPDCFLPYTASQVTFNNAVKMTREGGGAGVLDVKAYGAAGNGVQDDTVAINAAIAAAQAPSPNPSVFGSGSQPNLIQASWEVFLPAGTYITTAALGPASNYTRIRGAGKGVTYIQCNTDNITILNWGGYHSYLGHLTLTFKNQQPATNTTAIGVALAVPQWAMMEFVNILHSGYGLFLLQAGQSIGAGGGTSNYVATSLFQNLYIQCSVGGIDINSFASGSEGSVWQQIYIQPRNDAGTPYTCTYGARFVSCSEGVINHLSINGSGFTTAGLYISSGDAFTVNSLHFETNQPTGTIAPFLWVDNSRVFVSSMMLYNNTISNANGVTNTGTVLRATTSASVRISGLSTRNNTVTGTTYFLWLVDGTACNIFFDGVKTTDATKPTPVQVGAQGNVRQYNTTTETWSNDRGDTSQTLIVGIDETTQQWNTPLTAGRTATLSLTGAQRGDRFRVVRTAAATGASTLTVATLGGGNKTLALGQWLDAVFDGTAWQEAAFGSL